MFAHCWNCWFLFMIVIKRFVLLSSSPTATLLVGFLSEGKCVSKSLITSSPLRSSQTSRMRTKTQIKWGLFLDGFPPLIHFLFTVQCHQRPCFYSSVFSGWWTRRRTTCCSTGGLRRINRSRSSASSQGVPHVDGLGVLQIVLFLSHTRGSSGHGQLILPRREKRTYWTFTQRTMKMWEGKERRLEPSFQAL